MTTIKISDRRALSDAIKEEFTTDDHFAVVNVNDTLSYYDNNGDPSDSALIYRLWLPDGSQGIAVSVYADREESVYIDADGYPE